MRDDAMHRLRRRDLLKAGTGGALAAGAAARRAAARRKHTRRRRGRRKGGGGRRDVAGMNVVLFITDQERAIQHFPKGWEAENLPAATRLKRKGLTFNRAFCNSCMCSPSRATLMTGYFPAQHGVKYTLETSMPNDQYPQVELPLDLPNIASVMGAAGYHVPYKGKWHLSKPPDGSDDFTPDDVNKYGFQRWDPPDAGANQDLDQFGGGDCDNDGRFMFGGYPCGDDGRSVDDDPAADTEGAIDYLKSEAAKQQPFFLVVSLVNPHDVLSYPDTYEEGGYNNSDLRGDIGLPKSVGEDLSTKPTAQRAALALLNAGLGRLPTDEDKTNYLNFYGNLMAQSDEYLADILDALEDEDLLENTLVIKTSDHGELGMAHQGMRQKIFNVYEEALRVPLTFSNPRLYPKPITSQALVSHVDFLPTLASLFKAPQSARADWQGVDYSRLVLNPEVRRRGKPKAKHKRKRKREQGVQDYVVFTYDDFQAGQPKRPYVPPPQHIVSIREGRYKLAKYYDVNGKLLEQWEMYDLKHDLPEVRNLAWPGVKRTKEQEKAYRRQRAKLARVEQERLQPL